MSKSASTVSSPAPSVKSVRGPAGRPSERSAFSYPSVIAFTVPIRPIGKERPRFGNGHVYTPLKTVTAERAIGLHANVAMKGMKPTEGPVVLTVHAFLPIPASWPKKAREAAREGHIYPTGKPDASNVLKLVEDALNEIVWIDDSQVVSAAVHKHYGEPHLGITVAAARDGAAL